MDEKTQVINEYEKLSTKELLDERYKIQENIKAIKPKYNASSVINGALTLVSAASIGGFVLSTNPIFQLSSLCCGIASSIGALVFMHSKFYMKSHNEYNLEKKKESMVQEALDERFNDELLEELEQ